MAENYKTELAKTITQLNQKHAAETQVREKELRASVKTEVMSAMESRIEKADDEKIKAIQAKVESEKRIEAIKADQEKLVESKVDEALKTQREILEKAKTDAVHQAKAEEFERSQKLQKQVERLQRQLEQKSNEELGEGAEIDLYEKLRDEYEDDKITRVKKGQPGADIIHEVRHNGKVLWKRS